ncbi:type I restriction endonuclease subunit R [Photobacterium chitinilyticum]|uniref:Type I restriction enzyme endonuclease subunit n=1 Tax=Photobacterium chitinilyticum TaxID=2485123 RepID=A0A444JIH7_9GAMM|nr:HsdR family type I site-specific deoxyribonuclease [Photobacterium chitinilyticum]RWX52892.1 type I restriction endonuclease subunit R [Photobacterium chitinilyticum]
MESRTLPDTKEEMTAKLPALELISKLGYTFIPPAQCTAMRGSTAQVVLEPKLQAYLESVTYLFKGKGRKLQPESIRRIISEVTLTTLTDGLISTNEKLFNLYAYGISITETHSDGKANPTIQLVNWKEWHQNELHFTEEMNIENSRGTGSRQPDIVCFVNGLPWVVIEAKRPAANKKTKITLDEGIRQNIRNQGTNEIPHLFIHSQLLISIDGHDARYGTCGTSKKFWSRWREELPKEKEDNTSSAFLFTPEQLQEIKNRRLMSKQMDAIFDHRPAEKRYQFEQLLAAGDRVVTEQDKTLIGLLTPKRLIEFVHLFTVFDSTKGKIVARYQQYFGIKRILERVQQKDAKGAREGGIIWHTTGSGKSLTMVLLTKALIWLEELKQCRIFLITDRVDLEGQLSDTFLDSGAYTELQKRNAIATSGKQLAKKITSGNERIVFSLIDKFRTAVDSKKCFNPSENIIVLVDEAHRGHGGENSIRMMQAMPNAAFIGFTGTPLLKKNSTERKFGPIIHSYTMQQATKDETVSPLLYEQRKPELCIESDAIDEWFARFTEQLSTKQKSDLKRKFAKRGQLYETEGRLELIAHDISDHFGNFKAKGLRGQLACSSKSMAIRYKQALDKIGKVTSAIVMSPPERLEGEEEVDQESKDLVTKWWKENVGTQDEKLYTEGVTKAFSKPGGPDIIIVVDKLLTGFDEPLNTVLYIDKSLNNHNLIQAVARVNRLHDDKKYGYLIDYYGILDRLDVTIKKYQDLAEQVQEGYNIDDLKDLYHHMETEYKRLPYLYQTLWQVFDGVKNKQDNASLRSFLAPDPYEIDGEFVDRKLKAREDFYAALRDFAKCLQVALQSASFFSDVTQSKQIEYKEAVKRFSELRTQVQQDANEIIDYDEYADEIKAMMDKHVVGESIDHDDTQYNVGQLGHGFSIEEMSPEKAKTEQAKIKGRVVKMIEQDLQDDPYAKAYFSELLSQALAEAEAMFDSPVKQYLLFEEFEKKVKNRDVDTMPAALKDNLEARAYYGLFVMDKVALTNDVMVTLSLAIDDTVKRLSQQFSINASDLSNNIELELLPMLFDIFDDIDRTTQFIAKIIDVVKQQHANTGRR